MTSVLGAYRDSCKDAIGAVNHQPAGADNLVIGPAKHMECSLVKPIRIKVGRYPLLFDKNFSSNAPSLDDVLVSGGDHNRKLAAHRNGCLNPRSVATVAGQPELMVWWPNSASPSNHLCIPPTNTSHRPLTITSSIKFSMSATFASTGFVALAGSV